MTIEIMNNMFYREYANYLIHKVRGDIEWSKRSLEIKDIDIKTSFNQKYRTLSCKSTKTMFLYIISAFTKRKIDVQILGVPTQITDVYISGRGIEYKIQFMKSITGEGILNFINDLNSSK